MSASVRCPVCASSCEVPAELLGRTGKCKQCGQRIRLATPTAELIEAPIELAPLDNLGELEPVGNLLPQDAAPAPRPPKPRPKRVAAPLRGPSKAVFAAVALVGLLGGSATGAMLVKYLLPVEQPQPTESAKADTPAPKPPTPKPIGPEPKPQPPEPKPQPPEPKLPEPKPPEPKPPEPKPQPPEPKLEPKLGQKIVVKLPVAAAAVFAGERFIVFQTTDGGVTVFDVQGVRQPWTINGGKPEDAVAVGRTKMFLGRANEPVITIFDLVAGGQGLQATLEGEAPTLKHLAIGSASDGPLLRVARANDNTYRVRLIDTDTFGQFKYPIDDPTEPRLRAFPFVETILPKWAAMSADGRGLTLGNRYFARASDQYKGGLLPITGSAQHLPTTDAGAYIGTRLYAADGTPIQAPALPPGTSRRYIPAAAGPFVVSAEYRAAARGTVKLSLHLGADPNPLGPLPGNDDVGAWAKTDIGWVAKLHHHVVFVPNPPRLIVCPPGADTAQVYPVDLTDILTKAGHAVTFTSTAPADVPTGRAYVYQATAVSARGPVTFRLDSGPPGMTITADGVLNWPKPTAVRNFYEVSLTATDSAGSKATQTFRLLVPGKVEMK